MDRVNQLPLLRTTDPLDALKGNNAVSYNRWEEIAIRYMLFTVLFIWFAQISLCMLSPRGAFGALELVI